MGEMIRETDNYGGTKRIGESKHFFGEEGLTATSAKFVINLAKEMVREFQVEMKNISLVNKYIAPVGRDEKTVMQYGLTSLDSLSEKMRKIADANALMAWLNEAVKEHEAAVAWVEKHLKDVYNLSDNEAGGRVQHAYTYFHPEEGPIPVLFWNRIRMMKAEYSVTFDDILAELPAEELSRYLVLEAKASAYGKFVHPQQPFAEARNELQKRRYIRCDNSNYYREVVELFEPSIGTEEVEDTYFRLQKQYRDYQAQFNRMKMDLEAKLAERQRIFAEKKQEIEDEKAAEKTRRIKEVKEFFIARKEELDKERIIIPERLRPIFEEVQQLGKKRE